jgi:hypothetical protein
MPQNRHLRYAYSTFVQKFKCMKFFIDTANLSEIKEANDLGILDGVTNESFSHGKGRNKW